MKQFETIEEFVEALEIWCSINSVDLRINTRYHYTLMKDDFRIDLWPVNQKYHIVTQPQERGVYDEFEDICNKHFNDSNNFQ